MKIAIFTETFLPQINGVVRTIERIVKHLEANGHEVLLFTIGQGEDNYSQSKIIRLDGIDFVLYPELKIVKPEDKWLCKLLENEMIQTPIAFLQSLLPSKNNIVKEALEKFQPNLIHIATPATLGAIAFYYAEEMNLPCLATFHTDLAAYAPMYQFPYATEIVNAVTKMVYTKANRVLAPSPSSQLQLGLIGLKNVGIFGRGVDGQLFNPKHKNKKILSKYGLDPNLITVLYVGRLAEEKSIPDLLTSFTELSFNNSIQLLIIGDGPVRSNLEALLAESKSKYSFAGIQKGEELACLYASSDIFAFPSRTETFGQVVLEAMASGLPVLGYDSPGVRDLIEDQKSGILVNSLSSFKLGLELLVQDSQLRESYGQNSRELALQRSWDKILNSLLEEYKSLSSLSY